MTKEREKKCVKVHSNLLQQNVYILDSSLSSDVKSEDCPSTYVTLVEEVTDSGLTQRFEEVPYPITPETVASYASACDYKQDPVSAMSASPRGVNLGDVSVLQDISSLDSEQASALYAQLKARFAEKPTEKSTVENVDVEVKE